MIPDYNRQIRELQIRTPELDFRPWSAVQAERRMFERIGFRPIGRPKFYVNAPKPLITPIIEK